jgi:hypothetical protein
VGPEADEISAVLTIRFNHASSILQAAYQSMDRDRGQIAGTSAMGRYEARAKAKEWLMP